MCEDCRIRNLERKRAQFDEPRAKPIKKGGYESKSKKVWRDRYEAARTYLKLCVGRYVEGIRRGYYLPGNDSWIYGRIKRSDWVASKYRKARADAKAHGAI